MAKKSYVYKIEILNMASGAIKGVREYKSNERLKRGNVYFRLPGLPVGAYRVVGEINKQGAEDE